MRAKHLVTKLIKLLSSMFPSWKIWGSEIEIKLQQQTFWNVSWQKDVGNCCCLGRTFGRAARLQPIYKKKIISKWRSPSWRNQSYLTFLFKHMETMLRTYNIRSRNLRTALKRYFWFHWNYKQLRVEAKNVLNCEIYFPLFSETISTIFKNISTAWS